ncbi:MAG TPA: hypothetical protein VJW75_07780 [Candidatus Eisenbacteria bacterium]|nr:hypothetical protein [Candidatus Eisenbacteria bacterium]
MICAKLKPAVSGLEQAFPGKVTARNVDASTPDARKAIKELGFKSHGLVVKSRDGQIVMKQPDHSVDVEAVKTTLRGALRT